MKPHCILVKSFDCEYKRSPLPISCSAPPVSKIVLESILEVTLNAILAGKLAVSYTHLTLPTKA